MSNAQTRRLINPAPARFVTLCFIYSGLALLAQAALTYPVGWAWLSNSGIGLIILFNGFYRLWKPHQEEHRPTEYGFMAYAMGGLSIVVTALLLWSVLS